MGEHNSYATEEISALHDGGQVTFCGQKVYKKYYLHKQRFARQCKPLLFADVTYQVRTCLGCSYFITPTPLRVLPLK